MGILDKLMSKDMGLTQSEREDLAMTASKLKEELNAKYNAQTAKVKAKDGVDGKDGKDGKDGQDGRDGRNGRDGTNGLRGPQGELGRHGIDGADGVSVTDAHIDFDGSLIIDLSTGRSINVGEVVSQDLEERIKIVTSGGAGSGGGGSGTVTSVAATAGTGISITGSPITTSGTLNITNTAPDQTVALTQGGTTTITGTYPNFTISSADQFVGTVTSVTGTSPVVSSGGTTPAISLASGYGDTLNPYASKTANFVLAAPNGSAGVPTFRAIVASDIPTLNQSTTGNAATVTTNANLTGAVTSIGNATSLGSFTSAELAGALTDETGTGAAVFATSPTLVTPALGTPASGVVTNLTGTASININGTVGATTASTGAFTTLSASGVTTVQAGTAVLPAITTTGDTNTGIFFPAADTVAFAEGGAEAMRINSSGFVGIGTTTPAYLVDVVKASAGSAVRIWDNTTSSPEPTLYLQRGTDATWGADAFTDYKLMATAGNFTISGGENGVTTERARIDSSGNFLVGATSALGSEQVYFVSASASKDVLVVNNSVSSGTGERLIRGRANGSDRFYVLTNGNVQNTNNSYGAISDIKLKENVVDATPKLEKLNQVRIVNYNLIGDTQKQIGVIAQELEEVCPSMVEETADRDAEGNDLGTTTKSVKYSVFVPMLIKAIQEQQALITALTSRITALETP